MHTCSWTEKPLPKGWRTDQSRQRPLPLTAVHEHIVAAATHCHAISLPQLCLNIERAAAVRCNPLKVVRLGGSAGATAKGSAKARETRRHAHYAAATAAGAGVGGEAHIGRRGRCAVGRWWHA